MLICSERISPADLNVRIIYRIFGSVKKNCWTHKERIVGPRKIAGSEEKSAGSGNVGPLMRTDARIQIPKFKLVSGSAKRWLDPKVFGSAERSGRSQTEKDPEPGIVEPWPELTGGSENLNCRRIFGSAKKIVGSESVGSAANVLDSDGKRLNADPYRKRFACC